MKTYNIKFVSFTNSIVYIAFLCVVIFNVTKYIFPPGINRGLSFVITVIALAIICFLWQLFVTGRTEWTIDEKGIQMCWVKKFIFHNSLPLNIKWDGIEKIGKLWYDNKYYDLIIKLKSGEKIRFYHDNLTMRDDFKEFIKALNSTFKEKQEGETLPR